MKQIKAITFDLWDTVINDDSDEPVRAERGLRSKRDERHYLVWKALNTVSTVSIEAVRSAYEEVNDQFNRVWHDDFITWTVDERVDKVLKMLNRVLPKSVLQNTIEELERMEIVIPPEPVRGVHAAMDELSGNFILGVVSDTVVTPGRNLRVWLENHDLLRFLKCLRFRMKLVNPNHTQISFVQLHRNLAYDWRKWFILETGSIMISKVLTQ